MSNTIVNKNLEFEIFDGQNNKKITKIEELPEHLQKAFAKDYTDDMRRLDAVQQKRKNNKEI